MFKKKVSSLKKFEAAKLSNAQAEKVQGGADLKAIAEQLVGG